MSNLFTMRSAFILKTALKTGFVGVRQSVNVRKFSVSIFRLQYNAAVLKEFGQPLTIETMKRKKLMDNEVRIGVYCCGVNSIDRHNCVGDAEPPPTLPLVPGFEVCGEVLEVSNTGENVPLIKPGQRVIGLHADMQGGFAEEMIISAKDVWVVDNSIPFSTGASLINSYTTALLALTRRAEVKQGDTVLVTGAAGRLGLAAVDLAANVYRCKVIAVCTTDDKASALRERGAFATVTLGKQDLRTQVEKVTEGEGVTIIVDTVGGDVFNQVVSCVADEGKIVVAGFASRKIPQISGDKLMESTFSVLGVSLEQYRKKKYDVYRQAVDDVIEMCQENLVKPFEAKHYPLENINEVLELLKDRKSIGKFVLDIK